MKSLTEQKKEELIERTGIVKFIEGVVSDTKYTELIKEEVTREGKRRLFFALSLIEATAREETIKKVKRLIRSLQTYSPTGVYTNMKYVSLDVLLIDIAKLSEEEDTKTLE